MSSNETKSVVDYENLTRRLILPPLPIFNADFDGDDVTLESVQRIEIQKEELKRKFREKIKSETDKRMKYT